MTMIIITNITMGNTSQCTEYVDHEDDNGTDLSVSPAITVKMTMTKRRAYLSPRLTTIIITITILEPIIVATHFVPPVDGLPVNIIPSEPDATT